MKRNKRVFVCPVALAAIMLLAGSRAVASPQESPQEPAAPALDLSSDIQSRGSEVALTLSLTVPDGVEIGKVVSEIAYPGSLLVFEEARRGLSAEAVAAEITAEPQTSDTNPEESMLRVTITAKEGEWLPAGMMADLMFKISEQAPEETTIALKNRVAAWTAEAPPAPVESITGKDGQVQVTANPPVFACFFYMH
ncbi:MAG: hypothetical protein HYX74_01940 [Acidobacteria bacterium]|nr:hypothetical protein [Acidobacteriota bacterium]